MRKVTAMLGVLSAYLLVLPAAAAGDPGILFSVKDYTHSGGVYSGAGKDIQTLIEPIAYLANGKLVKIPDDVDVDEFGKLRYPDHQKYPLYQSGKAVGTVEVVKPAFDIQCFSLAAIGAPSPANGIAGMRMGLASNINFKDDGYSRRAPTATELAAIMDMARQQYEANKVDAAEVSALQVSNVTVFENSSGAIMVGSFRSIHTEHGPGFDDDVINAALVIAERVGKKAYSSTYTWYHSGSDASLEERDLVDILDLDGDGIPEIVIQSNGYEDTGYDIYKKSTTGWDEIFEASASGC